MGFTFIEFLIGFTLMNAMPHFLFGLLKIRFLSAFGFSWQGNIGYGLFNVTIALGLFQFRYGLQELMGHGVVMGAGAVILIYLVTGRFFYKLFQSKDESHQQEAGA